MTYVIGTCAIKPPEIPELAVSVGGTKLYVGLVAGRSPSVIARSGRIEWDRAVTSGIETFVELIARQTRLLLEGSNLPPERVEQVGVAWPGPGIGGRWEATFIPECQSPQPIVDMLRTALMKICGSGFAATPITIVLDAVARAAGETQTGGALYCPPDHRTSNALLINVATGVAGAIVENGRVLLSHREFGEPYGQFGRFLLFDTNTKEWKWRPTRDGSVPTCFPQEVRLTRHCAGPALARRIARACQEFGIRGEENQSVAEALRYCAGESESRIPRYETTLLTWATAESYRAPESQLGEFIGRLAEEFGNALRVLTREVFAEERIKKIVLAGGVGENFGGGENPNQDKLIENIRRALGPEVPVVCRAKLGVDAELLGFSSLR